MWPVSSEFLETVSGSHRRVSRLVLCKSVQFGPNPEGDAVPMLEGSAVTLHGTADVKAQLSARIPGEWWEEVAPYGVELFAATGVAFGDGRTEYVPLGYFPIEEPEQPDAPFGPISIDVDDRTTRLVDTRVIYPWQIPDGTTHRQVVAALVNGVSTLSGTYGMYGAEGGPTVPIIWTNAGYNPDTTTVGGSQVVDGSAYDFLAKLVDAQGAQLRFLPTGELAVVRRDPPLDAEAVYALRQGKTGTLVRRSRKVSRKGTYNIVRTTGSDPQYQTGYRLAYNTDASSPLRWNGKIGPRVRYYASPLLTSSEEADKAAETILSRATGLPEETGLWTVPNPALQPLDVVSAPTSGGFGTWVLDEVAIPLVGGGELALKTRTLNAVENIETNPEPEPEPGPGPDPDPGPGPTPTPGGGSSEDGIQAAILNGWGTKLSASDEFVGNTIDTSKWGLYNGTGHSGNGTRRPAAFSQHDGMLTITGDNNNQSGGAAFRYKSYGYRVECRIRVYRDGDSPGRTDNYHPVLILWPDSDEWPEGAEYDFFESDEGDNKGAGFMHLPNHTPYRQDHFTFPADISKWFNMACEWNPKARTLKTWCDGKLVYDGKGRVAEAPGSMHLTFQLDHFGGKPRRCKFDMAWARVYAKPNA